MRPLGFAVLIAAAFAFPPASAPNVKITPHGSHTGELCDRDRATIFEHPTGVRISEPYAIDTFGRRASSWRR
jgi:hypothetical protein